MTQNKQNRGGVVITFGPLTERSRAHGAIIFSIIAILCILSLLFTPFYIYTVVDGYSPGVDNSGEPIKLLGDSDTIIPFDVFNETEETVKSAKLISLGLFVGIVVLAGIGGAMLFSAVRRRAHSEARAFDMFRNLLFFADCVTGGYYIAGVVTATAMNYTKVSIVCSPSVGIQLWVCIGLTVAFAAISRGVSYGDADVRPASPSRGARIEYYIYYTAIAALSVAAALSDILRVVVDLDDIVLEYNGLEALKGNAELAGGLQLLTFFVLAVLAVNVSLLLLSLVSLISRTRSYWKITTAGVVCGSLSTLLIGLFGKYYEIAQKINEEMILEWVNAELNKQFGGLIDDFIEIYDLSYEIESPSHWWLFAVIGVLAILLIRKPLSRGTKGEVIVAGGYGGYEAYMPEYETDVSDGSEPKSNAGDPCPAFTELDRRIVRDRAELEEAKKNTFESPTLPGLVDFVVSYARDSRLHLVYSHEDIAAFVAGLGSTRLTILQGMSGTGKTSLPKIFCEAIFGNCEIVEVESSWRDKNELLGYYNEFSRVYTPKKFTLALYRARLCPERTTFIVLDEMNLSRIEYYFSDFLSLMENEEDRREIKLLGTAIYPRSGGRMRYFGLSGGHTVKIPRNVWFVGTANRDESTFEISDKVYDRAHTMDFNKRAPRVRAAGEPREPRYLSADDLLALFEEARESVYFDIDTSPVVAAVEELLAPHNVTFGNRIANQIESFVRIYAACFGGTERAIADGLERILLSKVVHKLEYKQIGDKEELAEGFERLGLYRCRDFVLHLNED